MEYGRREMGAIVKATTDIDKIKGNVFSARDTITMLTDKSIDYAITMHGYSVPPVLDENDSEQPEITGKIADILTAQKNGEKDIDRLRSVIDFLSQTV